MIIKRTMLSRSLLVAFSTAGLYGNVAMAQSTAPQPPAASNTSLQGVEITGSRIRTIDRETAQPVLTVTAEDIAKSGYVTAADVVNSLSTAGTPSFTRGTSLISNSEQGGSYLDLRNVGSQRLLVLVNGRRWPTSANGFTDVSNIPAALIERVEVLKDGGSAVYGSDAIAGVVNFILKSKFQGFEGSAYYGSNEKGDGTSHQYDITWGANDTKGSLMANFTYSSQGAVFDRDRGITSQSYGDGPELFGAGFGAGPWGRARQVNNTTGALGPTYYLNHTGDFTGNGVGSNSRSIANYHTVVNINDNYNTAQDSMFQLPTELKSFLVKGDYSFNDHLRAKSLANYSERRSEGQNAGYPASTAATGVLISAASYYNPFGNSVTPGGVGSATSFQRRVVEVPRLTVNNYKTFHYEAGLEGDFKLLNRDYTWDAGVTYNKGTGEASGVGNLNNINLAKALGPSFLNAAGVVQCGTPAAPIALTSCVPFDILGGPSASTAAALNFVEAQLLKTYGNSLTSYTANVTGSPYKLPAGDLGIALGGEIRKTTGYDIPDALARVGSTTDLAAQITTGKDLVKEYYGELQIPILKGLPFIEQLSANIATRHSDYDSYGSTTRSKYSFVYKPIKDVLTRGTYAQGFRAPTIGDFAGGGSQSFDTYGDPCDTFRGAAATDPTVRARCTAAGVPAGFRQINQNGTPVTVNTQGTFPFLAGAGNPFLQPEKAVTKTMGIVYSPSYVNNLTLSADWYRIDISSVITGISAGQVLNNCYVRGIPEFCTSITRDPSTGQVNGLSRGNTNAGGLRTEGVDLGGSYLMPRLPYVGNLKLSLDGTYLIRYAFKSTDTTDYVDSQGNHPLYRWKANFAIDFSQGPWSARLMNRFYAGVRDLCPDFTFNCSNPSGTTADFGAGINDKHTLIYQDLNVAWETPWKGTISGGVNNLFGVKPRLVYAAGPANLSPISSSTSVDATLPIDRYFYVRYNQKF